METFFYSEKNKQSFVVIACLLITFCMGSLHAFSTLIENIELQIDVSRMASSLVYSTALICVTVAVFFGHILYRQLSPLLIIFLIASLPLIGILISNTGSWIGWIIGYGIFFGFASGLGYGFSLHAVSSVVSSQKLGLALGSVTASYAFGAVVFSIIYPLLFNQFTFKIGYIIGVSILSIVVIVALFLFHSSRIELTVKANSSINNQENSPKFFRLWLGYFLGVFAGLMTIGHAVPMIKATGGSITIAITGITLMSFGSGVAGVYAGWLSDRFGCKRPLVVILIINSIALFSLTIFININLTLILMILVASLYGAVIAIYPTLVNNIFGPDNSAWAYGRIFTAWGFAGLASPFLAGWLFDQSNQYNSSLLVAFILSILSAIIISRIPYNVKTAR
jgi:OFA family oxalate/formate antiporter-like MFS transporter